MVDKTFTADAILKATFTKTLTADAILKIVGEITLGAQTLTVDFDGIKPRRFKRTSKHSILGATNSKRQYLGADSTQYEIEGIWDGSTRDADMAIMRGYYDNNDEIAFQGYADLLASQVRIIELREDELTVHWEYRIIVEETGNP